jgi:RHS repeat-associated protein
VTVTNHIQYNSFGQITDETNSAVNHLFGFTGRALDGFTGLQNNLNRWYDSVTGRWVSEDPIVFEGADNNLQRYVANRPTERVDPIGLAGLTITDGTPVELGEAATFPFNGGTGKVSVTIDASTRDDSGDIRENRIAISFTADVPIPADTHWLQFFTFTQFDSSGNALKEGFYTLGRYDKDNGRHVVHQNAGSQYVDCGRLPAEGVLPYYGGTNIENEIRKDGEVTMLDRPFGVPPVGGKIIGTFHTILVSGGKPYIQISWESHITSPEDNVVVIKYDNIKITQSFGLPESAQGDTLNGGYIRDPKTGKIDDIKYPNPIAKPDRPFQFSRPSKLQGKCP